MKLLYCIPSLYNSGGMERVITEKVNYLINQTNVEITIVTTDQQNKDIYFKIDNRINIIHFNIDFNSHYSLNLVKKYFSHISKLRVYKKRLKKLIEEQDIDICISLCGKEIEFLNKLNVKCKKVAEIHFSMNYRRQFIMSRHKGVLWSYLGDFRTYQLKKSVKGLDKLVVLTQADKLQWELKHKNIIQIPNSNPLNNKSTADLDVKKVISIGRLDAQKGYDLLVESWALVARKYPDWILDIYGEGEWKIMLLNKIKKLNLIGKINLKGLIDDVETVYLNSSIYVMSSRYEGFGMVLIEAMSCGLPVISFDCEFGPGEIISHGLDGFLVEPNNIKQLAEKLCYLMENESIRKQMGLKARVNVNRFSKKEIMQQWMNLLQSIMT